MHETDRMVVVDALRGLALAGIVLVHMTEMYLAFPPSPEMLSVINSSPADGWVAAFVYYGLIGKFFSLFAFLFGLSFYIQMESAARRGSDFKGRFIWRLTVLAAIGVIHRSFYAGDILLVYAAVGLLLVPFHEVSNRTVLIVSCLLFLGVGRYAAFALWGNARIFDPSFIPSPAAYYEAIAQGSWLDVAGAQMARIPDLANFQILSGRGFLTLAFFLLGLLLGRSGWLRDLSSHSTQIRKAFIGSGVGVLAMAPISSYYFPGLYAVFMAPLDTWASMFALTSYDLLNLAATLLIASGFVLACSWAPGGRILSLLSPYGRMALTNYVTQSMIGTFIFFGWGLGMAGKLTAVQCFGLALCILLIQIVLSTWWLRHFRFGPLEWVWRCLTYLQWQPLLRTA